MDEDFRTNNSKLFYRPVEVAIRWCGLIKSEAKILREFNYLTIYGDLNQIYPCIEKKLEILWDAVNHSDLPYGCLGRTVPSGEYVEPILCTIRHSDLKMWFIEFWPNEKPAFLFDDLERQIALPSRLDAYNLLLAEIEIHKIQHERTQALLLKFQKEKTSLLKENTALISKLRKRCKPSERTERAYLRVIGALILLMLGKSPSGKPYSSFTSQASIISVLMAHNRNKLGFSQRTLEDTFATANRSINDFE
ncbi:hypothetical protein I7860_18970 [Pseudomonas tolaasii]|uniref:hypothetical protein n=1 Tax=Pseudomonas tolaasii TaxID=29442 RepID=UPI001C598A66|nr:hypothetical protein [Pseudomonas tolaasii]MBW1248771.1 hypothetical protein [Pseudomonas tolaasii]